MRIYHIHNKEHAQKCSNLKKMKKNVRFLNQESDEYMNLEQNLFKVLIYMGNCGGYINKTWVWVKMNFISKYKKLNKLSINV